MNSQQRQLLETAIQLLHRVVALDDAIEDFATVRRGRFRIEGDDRREPAFPTNAKTPPPERAGADFLDPDVGTSGEAEQGFVEFTDKEIQTMPKNLRQLIIVNRQRGHMRRKPCGSGYSYEIRFRGQGYNISASGKTKELAKQNMLHKLRMAPTPQKVRTSSVPTTFNSFACYYFENYRRRKVSDETYKNDLSRYHKYLAPHFGEKLIAKITLVSCQELIDRITEQGKYKTADEVYSLMNVIFTFAVENHIIDRRPSDAVLLEAYQADSGTALTKEEEAQLLAGVANEPTYQVAIALALYTGLRPNELESAVIEGKFIKAINSKRHNKKTEYKLIPIIKRLRPYIANGIPTLPPPKLIRRRMKAILPDHRLYDLRTTFYTRCQEMNVAETALKEFMGHSFGTLGNAYSDLSKSVTYLLKEGEKLNSW